jgi:hypothetical protein
MTEHIAFELSRQRLEETATRASLVSRLGELPKPQAIFPFRRQVISLPGIVEVRRHSDKERIRRRLMELSAATAPRSERKAS